MVIDFKYAIGDVLYVANAYDVDKVIIKAVKVESIKEKKLYGYKRENGRLLYPIFWGGDDYTWVSQTELFTDKDDAIKKHEVLKAKHEAEQLVEKEEAKRKRLAKLKQKLEDLENGKDVDDYDYED